MASKHKDWEALGERFVRREWPTLEAMAKDLRISYSTLVKNARKGAWSDRRQKVADEARQQTDELIAMDQAQANREAAARLMRIAHMAQAKGLQPFTKQLVDSKGKPILDAQGRPKQVEVESQSIGLGLLRFGTELEARLRSGRALGEEPFAPPAQPQQPGIIVNGNAVIMPTEGQARLKQAGDAELEAIIAEYEKVKKNADSGAGSRGRKGT